MEKVEQVDREAAKSLLGRDDAGPSWWSIDSGNADSDQLVQAFARHRREAVEEVVAWHPIETAPKDEMILSHADGMVRLVMWESGQWVQVGATIESGWYEPTHWQRLPELPAQED